MMNLGKLYIPEKHKHTLDFFINNLQTSKIASSAVTVFGSATRPDSFINEYSDIDLCIHSKFTKLPEGIKLFEEEMSNLDCKIIMPPRAIVDYQGPRIESFIDVEDVVFDLTWIPLGIPKVGNSTYEVLQDNFELHIGSIYIRGVTLWGEIPTLKIVQDEFIPFYGYQLQNDRMNILMQEIRKKRDSLKRLIEKKELNIFSILRKLQKIFLQWLFISQKQYAWSYDKEINRQLDEILGLKSTLIKKIVCIEGKNIYEIAENFLKAVAYLSNE